MSIAAVILMRERRIVERFRTAGATTPEEAQPPADLVGIDALALRRLRWHAVIRESPTGAYYLDEPSWSSLRGMRRRILAVLITVGLVAAFGTYFVLGR